MTFRILNAAELWWLFRFDERRRPWFLRMSTRWLNPGLCGYDLNLESTCTLFRLVWQYVNVGFIPKFWSWLVTAIRNGSTHSKSSRGKKNPLCWGLRRQRAATTYYIGTTLLRVGCLVPVLFFLTGSNMCEAPSERYVHKFKVEVRDPENVDMGIDHAAGISYPKGWKVENYLGEYRARLCKDDRKSEPP